MRLLHVDSLEFQDFRDDNRPPYAIASHRWLNAGEVTFREFSEIRDGQKADCAGFQKVKAFTTYIQRNLASLNWLWIDTCCIDKDNAAELSEAINLMFEWYHMAEVCLAYLADVEMGDKAFIFEKSEWFERGWTLQELLAPRTVVFLSSAWDVIGYKGNALDPKCGLLVRSNLERRISYTTKIPEEVLHNYGASKELSVDAKLKWMEGRTTTRPEDMSYALFGILDVTPGANYGEKSKGARQRLMAAIDHRDNAAAQQAEKSRRIADWLKSSDPWTNHDSAGRLHQPYTGTWMLKSDQYRAWKANTLRHLWLYGKAGCGKTILCFTAIVNVREYCERHPSAGYAIFYFSFSDDKKQRLGDLLRSLVIQLGWKGQALTALQQAYEKPNRPMLGQAELESVLLLCFQSYEEVFLLIDALDECPEDDDIRLEMVECLIRFSQKATNVKIFATSRELPGIRQSMVKLGAEPTAVAIKSVDKDIREYAAAQLSRDPRLSRLDRRTRVQIEETISEKADGMFRWAYCQMQELKKVQSTKPKHISEKLRNLPATLDATYERMLTRIEYRYEAIVLLQWLAYAQSPPSLGELVEATTIDFAGEGRVEEDELGGLEDTLEILSGLVVVLGVDVPDDHYGAEHEDTRDAQPAALDDGDQRDDYNAPASSNHRIIGAHNRVRLAHFSVKEYLESTRILQSEVKEFYLDSSTGQRLLAQSCLIYILHYSRSDKKLSAYQDFVEFPLLKYAARSWYFHAHRQRVGECDREVSLLSETDTRHDWLLVCQPDREWKRPFETLRDTGFGLYYASFTGLKATVEKLLENGEDVDAQGGEYGNALQAASWGGHEKVVQMLMDAGADVKAQGGEYGNALQAASVRGHEKVVQMLMDAISTRRNMLPLCCIDSSLSAC